MAAICRPLADTAHPLATSEPSGRGQNGGLRFVIEGKRRATRQAIGNGGRRLGVVLHRSGNQATTGRLSPKMSQYIKNPKGPTSRSARESGHQLSHEDTTAARMREASPRDRVGRGMLGRSHQRHLPAVDFLPAMSTVSALLPAESRSFQGKIA